MLFLGEDRDRTFPRDGFRIARLCSSGNQNTAAKKLDPSSSTMVTMAERISPQVEVIDVAPGLWIWRIEHPGWKPDDDGQQVVTSVCVD